jgi:hypothetical protein
MIRRIGALVGGLSLLSCAVQAQQQLEEDEEK